MAKTPPPPDDRNLLAYAWVILQAAVNVNLPNFAARIANASRRISRS